MQNKKEFEGHYVLWQIRRLNWLLKCVGVERFAGSNLLELGCGYAFFGEQFSRMGGNVLCIDGRQEHIGHVNRRLVRSGNKAIQTRIADLNHDFSNYGKFDIVVDMGLLYHLEKPESHIVCLSKIMHEKSILILESVVADYDSPFAFYRDEDGYDQSLTHRSRILSPASIESNLDASGFIYEDISSKEMNASIHCYDWSFNNTRMIQNKEGIYFRKMWLIRKDPRQTNRSQELTRLRKRIVAQELLLADVCADLSVLKDEKENLSAEINLLSEQKQKYRHERVKLEQQLQETRKENRRLQNKRRNQADESIKGLIEKNEVGRLRVAIFGAGEHTEKLFRTTDIEKLSPVMIFDNDRSKWALNFQNIPIKDPETINACELDCVIISSLEFEKEIYTQLKGILNSKTSILPLYSCY